MIQLSEQISQVVLSEILQNLTSITLSKTLPLIKKLELNSVSFVQIVNHLYNFRVLLFVQVYQRTSYGIIVRENEFETQELLLL